MRLLLASWARSALTEHGVDAGHLAADVADARGVVLLAGGELEPELEQLVLGIANRWISRCRRDRALLPACFAMLDLRFHAARVMIGP